MNTYHLPGADVRGLQHQIVSLESIFISPAAYLADQSRDNERTAVGML